MSNRDLAPNLDDLVTWQIEEIRQMGGIALHEGKQRFLPTRQAFPVLAPYHRLVSDKVGYVCEIDGAAALLQLTQQAGNIRSLHESVVCDGAPEVRRRLRDCHPHTPDLHRTAPSPRRKSG